MFIWGLCLRAFQDKFTTNFLKMSCLKPTLKGKYYKKSKLIKWAPSGTDLQPGFKDRTDIEHHRHYTAQR